MLQQVTTIVNANKLQCYQQEKLLQSVVSNIKG